jgi:hypothetical protein
MTGEQLDEVLRELADLAVSVARMGIDLAALAAEGDRLAAECARARAGLRQVAGLLAEVTPAFR